MEAAVKPFPSEKKKSLPFLRDFEGHRPYFKLLLEEAVKSSHQLSVVSFQERKEAFSRETVRSVGTCVRR